MKVQKMPSLFVSQSQPARPSHADFSWAPTFQMSYFATGLTLCLFRWQR